MQHLLTDRQKAKHAEFKNFVTLNVEPFAETWDREQRIPDLVISMLANSGYLGCSLPPRLRWTRMGHRHVRFAE